MRRQDFEPGKGIGKYIYMQNENIALFETEAIRSQKSEVI